MKTAIITGGTSGLGLETVKQLLDRSFKVIVLGRNFDALQGLKAQFENSIDALKVDYADLHSITEAAEYIRSNYSKIDVLINNTAVNLQERRETQQGLEMHFGVNYLAHFHFTKEVLQLLEAAPQGRIVNVGAVQLAKNFLWENYNLTENWKNMSAVTNAKLGIFMFTKALARKLKETNVTVNVLDPGLVRTPYHDNSSWILKIFVKLLGKSPEKCVRENYVWLATNESLEDQSGKFYSYKKEKKLKGDAIDPDSQERLWALSEQIIDQSLS